MQAPPDCQCDDKSISYFSFHPALSPAIFTGGVVTGDEEYTLSDVRFGQTSLLDLHIRIKLGDEGQPLITYLPTRELVPPVSHTERMEWVRKSAQRFLEKVLEKEALVGAPPTDIS
jgi:hypothetical protein